MMENKYEISTGTLECYSNYVIFHFNAPVYEREQAKELTQVLDLHYKGRKCVVISNREMAKNVNPEVYKSIKSKTIVGIAIVSNNEAVRSEAYNEQELFRGAFSYFQSIEEAKGWADTVVDSF